MHERRKFLVSRSSILPYLPIEGGWNEFLRTRSAKYRKTTRNVANRIARLGHVQVEKSRTDPQGKILDAVTDIPEQDIPIIESDLFVYPSPVVDFITIDNIELIDTVDIIFANQP